MDRVSDDLVPVRLNWGFPALLLFALQGYSLVIPCGG